MAYTFLAAQGYEVGNSVLEADQIPAVKEVMAEAERRGLELVLPVDLVVATHFAPDAEHSVSGRRDAGRPGRRGRGPGDRELFAAKLADARTVFWNGPMGVFEFPAFSAGTARWPRPWPRSTGSPWWAAATRRRPVRALGIPEKAFGHISTGGGASLEYLEGKTLPGLVALEADFRDGPHSQFRRFRRPAAADGRELEDAREPPRGDSRWSRSSRSR